MGGAFFCEEAEVEKVIDFYCTFFIFKGRLQCIRDRYNSLDFSFSVKSCLIRLISAEQEFNTRSFK